MTCLPYTRIEETILGIIDDKKKQSNLREKAYKDKIWEGFRMLLWGG